VGEWRDDPLTGTATIVASGRAARPDTHRYRVAESARVAVADCPFCPGNEDRTPPEVARLGPGAPDTPGWRVRVVPNLYPIVGGTAGTPAGGPAAARGAHEVIVLSPAHHRALGDLDDDGVAEVFGMLRARAARHLSDGCEHVTPFVNHGRTAGASIEHPHAQLLALDVVPPGVRATEERFASARRDLVAEDMVGARARGLVVVDGPAPAWCPWASSWPYEMLVAHRSTRARFDEASDAELDAVARATRDALARLGALLGDVAYNVVVHSASRGGPAGYHWHVRITPRLVVRAGFELATGVGVNTVPPEVAAAELAAACDRR
jgi:UDPglucose--hexose-1-phosphate uridylyltransferase